MLSTPRLLSIWLLSLVLAGISAPAPADETPGLSRQVYERLETIHEQLEAGQASQAVDALRSLLAKSGLPAFDRAVLYETLGYAQAQREAYAAAATAFEQALAQTDELPRERRLGNLFNLAQMQYAAERPSAAVATLQRYLEQAPEPDNKARLLLTKASLSLERWAAALEAIQPLLTGHTRPKTNWYRLQLLAQMELERYTDAAQTLHTLLRREPAKTEYWRHLAAVYTRAGKDAKAAAVLELMWQRGQLTEHEAIKALAMRQIELNNPHRAAEILTEAMAKGQLPASVRHLKWLARAWLLAREEAKAREVLARAAPKASHGKLYLRLAQLEYEREQWPAVAKAARAALAKGRLRHPGQAHLLLGIAQYHQGNLAAARNALQAAREDQRSRQAAQGWLQYLEQ